MMRIICCFACALIFSACIFTQTKPPEAITVQAPVSVATTIDPRDSTFLQLKQVQDSSYNISVMGRSLNATSFAMLDEFITANKASIDTEKVLVYHALNSNDTTMIKIADIFRKHHILRFRIMTN